MQPPSYRTTDPEIIASGLKALRRRRMIVWSSLLAPFLAFAVLNESYVGYIIPFYFLAMMLGLTSIVLSECPRCGELFHIKGIFSSTSTRYCLHCHLPLKEAPAKPEAIHKKEPTHQNKRKRRRKRNNKKHSSR